MTNRFKTGASAFDLDAGNGFAHFMLGRFELRCKNIEPAGHDRGERTDDNEKPDQTRHFVEPALRVLG